MITKQQKINKLKKTYAEVEKELKDWEEKKAEAEKKLDKTPFKLMTEDFLKKWREKKKDAIYMVGERGDYLINLAKEIAKLEN